MFIICRGAVDRILLHSSPRSLHAQNLVYRDLLRGGIRTDPREAGLLSLPEFVNNATRRMLYRTLVPTGNLYLV